MPPKEKIHQTTMRFALRTVRKIDRHRGGLNRTQFVELLVEQHDERDAAKRREQRERKIHDLKCWPRDFEAIRAGTKLHEARKDDREYEVGDILRLHEWMPDDPDACDWTSGGEKIRGQYTKRTFDVLVTHITRGQYGLPPDLAVMSIRKEGER